MKKAFAAVVLLIVSSTAFAHPLDTAPWIGDGRPDQNGADCYEEDPALEFCAEFVKDGVVANGTQSAQAIGLYLGLVPEAQDKAAEARLVKAIEEKGCGPATVRERRRVDVALCTMKGCF